MALLLILVAVAVIAGLVLAGKAFSRSVVGAQSSSGARALGPAGPDDYEEAAGLVAPAEQKEFGVLRLTPTELQFAGRREPVLIDRALIESVDTVHEVDGDRSERPALRVRLRDGRVLVFAVVDPSPWLARLS